MKIYFQVTFICNKYVLTKHINSLDGHTPNCWVMITKHYYSYLETWRKLDSNKA